MRLNIAIPEAQVAKPVLDAALEAVTRLDEDLIKKGISPTSDQLIERGAKWQPEKPGAEHFDHGAIIAERGHGDCDDWAPLAAATLRVTGEDPGARAVVRRSGPTRWHAVCELSDGSEYDPSLEAGMPGPARVVGIRGAWVPQMFKPKHDVGSYIALPHLALRPIGARYDRQPEAWQARADLPWHWAPPGHSPLDVAMASLHASPVPDQAVVGAVRGAYRLGLSAGAHPEQLDRLAAIAAMCNGEDWESVADLYGEDHATAAGQIVGSFFGKLTKGLGRLAKGALKVASPLIGPALSIIPGGGIAKAAFDAASPALKGLLSSGRHQPQRAVAPLTPAPAPSSRAAPFPGGGGGGGGSQQWMPYPYPLPYPIPGWTAQGGASRAQPGVAWPPRG